MCFLYNQLFARFQQPRCSTCIDIHAVFPVILLACPYRYPCSQSLWFEKQKRQDDHHKRAHERHRKIALLPDLGNGEAADALR
jgi:hypothetical protein